MKLRQALGLAPRPGQPAVITFVGAGGKSSALFRLAQEFADRGERVLLTATTHLSRQQASQSPATLLAPNGQLNRDELRRALDQHGQALLLSEIGPVKAAGIPPGLVDALAGDAELGLSALVVEGDGSRGLPLKAPADHEPVIPASVTHLVPVAGLDVVRRPLAEAWVHRPQKMAQILGGDALGRPISPAQVARLLLHPLGGAKGRQAGVRFVPLLNKADGPLGLVMARLIARHLAGAGVSCLVSALGSRGEAVTARHGPGVAVVLAAGEGRRMGQAKQLLPVDGEPMVARAVTQAIQSGADGVRVVIGAHGDRVAAALQPLLGERVRLVVNPRWAEGQSTSVLAGLGSLPPDWAYLLFLPVDQPDVPPALLRRMIRLWEEGADLVAPQVGDDLRGAPALFDRRWADALAQVQGDRGAGPLLKRHATQVTPIPARAEWLADLDTPEAWAKRKAEIGRLSDS